MNVFFAQMRKNSGKEIRNWDPTKRIGKQSSFLHMYFEFAFYVFLRFEIVRKKR